MDNPIQWLEHLIEEEFPQEHRSSCSKLELLRLEVYQEILKRLKEEGSVHEDYDIQTTANELWTEFAGPNFVMWTQEELKDWKKFTIEEYLRSCRCL